MLRRTFMRSLPALSASLSTAVSAAGADASAAPVKLGFDTYSLRAEAQDLGVKIALENHSGDLQGREVKTIIEEAGKDYVASCLDTGNPVWCIEDPFVALEALAPYVVTTHVRDSVVFETANGA